MFRMFLDDPQVIFAEAGSLLKPIMNTVRQFSTNRHPYLLYPIIISAGSTSALFSIFLNPASMSIWDTSL